MIVKQTDNHRSLSDWQREIIEQIDNDDMIQSSLSELLSRYDFKLSCLITVQQNNGFIIAIKTHHDGDIGLKNTHQRNIDLNQLIDSPQWQQLLQNQPLMISDLASNIVTALFAPLAPLGSTTLLTTTEQPQHGLIMPFCTNQQVTSLLVVTHCSSLTLAPTDIDTIKQLTITLGVHVMTVLLQAMTSSAIKKHQWFEEVEKIAGIGSWEFDIANNQLYWSDGIYHIYGIEPGTPITPELAISHYPDESNRMINECFYRAINEHIDYDVELLFIDNQGQQKWIRTTGKVRDKNDIASHIYGVFEDITVHKQALRDNVEQNTYLSSILDNLNDAVISVNNEGVILSTNRTTERMFACDKAALIGHNVSCLMPEPYATMHQQYIASYLKSHKAKIIGVGRELPAIRHNGERFPMELSLSETTQNGQQIFIGIIKDITEREEAKDKIYQLAYYDSVTSLPNRASFEKDLEQLLDKARLTDGQLMASLIDVDRFAQVNLTYGKTAGDYALDMIGKRISGIIPKAFKLYHDNADRYFMLHVVPIKSKKQQAAIDTIELCCQSILQTVSDKIAIHTQLHHITVSIGTAILASEEINPTLLIKFLEKARQKAKHKGGNCHVIIGPKERAEIQRQTLLLNQLPKALEQQELFVYLQPQFNQNQEIIGAEALIRWFSPEYGFVSPEEFIPLAETSVNILDIGHFVLDQVCQLLQHLKSFAITPVIAVNISAKQIVQLNFDSLLQALVQQYAIDPGSLMLEITETTLVSDIELVRERMLKMSAAGFRFSIDDFGTGYSSLSYLKELPLHELKIDRYFVTEIRSDSKTIPIVNTILQMAQALEVQVVAEGIETKDQFDYLKQRQCDIYQGYYFARPMPITQCIAIYWPQASTNKYQLTDPDNEQKLAKV